MGNSLHQYRQVVGKHLVRKRIPGKKRYPKYPCCEKSQSVNKQTDQREDKVTLSPSTGSVRKFFITFIAMVWKEGVGVGRGGRPFVLDQEIYGLHFVFSFMDNLWKLFLPKISIATEKTQSLVLIY